MPPKITRVRFSRTSFAAVGTHNAILKLKQSMRNFFDSYRTKEIIIRRNPNHNRIKTFDMFQYSNMIYPNIS